MIAVILACFFFLTTVVLAALLVRASKKLLFFDDLFKIAVDDADVNIEYFNKLLTTDLFTNSAEIKTANDNMRVMLMRLEEFISRAEEHTGKKFFRRKDIKPPPRPKSA